MHPGQIGPETSSHKGSDEDALGAARGCYDIARNAIAVVDQQDKTIINLMAQVSLLKERKAPFRVVQDNELPPEAR
jgi:hypothetical protein